MKKLIVILAALLIPAFAHALPIGDASSVSASNSSSLKGTPSLLVGHAKVGTDAAEAGSTSTVIVATAHAARIGDLVLFYSGTAANLLAYSNVTYVAANAITLGNALPAAPAATDNFFILRPLPASMAQAEVTPATMVSILPTAQPTAFGTPQFANTASLLTVTVDNATGDTEIWCAYNGATAPSFAVPAGSVFTDNFGARGQKMSGAVGCIHPGNTPAAGVVRIYGE